ncbi:5-hydroxytryptamine receptor 3A-like [Mixophyes fleayi]|uniref:5-hydroxytryptamine receptor 3A-like n=1 Tax=Mixophyes fleayi TaxID=3061075 RepID=UPI003F4DE556
MTSKECKEWQDTNLQSLTTISGFDMTWNNEYISWNPDSFCGIQNIYITGEKLWKPDLYVYEMIQTEDKSQVTPFFILNNNGDITYFKAMRIVSSCKIHIYKFPFDRQDCNLSFSSYIYPDHEIVMQPKYNSSTVLEYSKSSFYNIGNWKLVNITVHEKNEEITIARVPDIYVVTLIMPVCFMVLMDIVSMFIQVDKGDRLGFKIIIVLGFSMLLLILNDMLPLSDTPPLLGIFCCACMATMVLSIFGSLATSYILMLSEKQTSVPIWVKIIFVKYLSCVLIFKRKPPLTSVNTPALKNDGNVDKGNFELLEKKIGSSSEVEFTLEVKLLKRILLTVLKIQKFLTVTKEQDVAKFEWYLIALVVDRLTLIIYLLIMSILLPFVIINWCT